MGWRQPAVEFLNDVLSQLGFVRKKEQAGAAAPHGGCTASPVASAHAHAWVAQAALAGDVPRFGYEVRFGGIDWSATRAYCDDTRSCVWINLHGRNPNGIVDPEDYDKLVEEVREVLLDLTDAETGQKVVASVWRPQEIYSGPYTDPRARPADRLALRPAGHRPRLRRASRHRALGARGARVHAQAHRRAPPPRDPGHPRPAVPARCGSRERRPGGRHADDPPSHRRPRSRRHGRPRAARSAHRRSRRGPSCSRRARAPTVMASPRRLPCTPPTKRQRSRTASAPSATCSQAVSSASRPFPSVVCVGLDGATFDIIDPLVAAGRLPTLAKLIESGTRAPHVGRAAAVGAGVGVVHDRLQPRPPRRVPLPHARPRGRHRHARRLMGLQGHHDLRPRLGRGPRRAGLPGADDLPGVAGQRRDGLGLPAARPAHDLQRAEGAG